MKNKILLIILVFLIIYYGKMRSFTNETSHFNYGIKVKDTSTSKIKEFDMEEYIIGVVAGEMPASFEKEALKAQAIASRTYAYKKLLNSDKNYDITNDTSSQVFLTKDQMKDKWQDKYEYYYEIIKNIVYSTKDQIMTYDGKIITSYYFSSSNGYTEDSQPVFGEQADYLKSVKSNEKAMITSINISKDVFCSKLKISCDKIIISDIERSISNRVNNITINNQVFKGTEIRKLLSLKSTDFDIELNDEIIITTRGYGHGVGMSQYGANSLAKEGHNYEEILKYYYQGIDISNISSII